MKSIQNNFNFYVQKMYGRQWNINVLQVHKMIVIHKQNNIFPNISYELISLVVGCHSLWSDGNF
jgi:hypothetical protein